MAINRKQIKRYLEAHQFGELFNQLGWDWPESDVPYPVSFGEELFKLQPVALKRGFIAYHCPVIPDSTTRAKIETKLSRDVREHIIGKLEPVARKIEQHVSPKLRVVYKGITYETFKNKEFEAKLNKEFGDGALQRILNEFDAAPEADDEAKGSIL